MRKERMKVTEEERKKVSSDESKALGQNDKSPNRV
jgi:hypothetical protein